MIHPLDGISPRGVIWPLDRRILSDHKDILRKPRDGGESAGRRQGGTDSRLTVYEEALLETLIQKIYEAAAGSAGWEGFLVCLANALGSRFPTLYLVDPIDHRGSLAISVGMDEKRFRANEQLYHKRDIWRRGAAARDLLRPGIVRLSHAMGPKTELLRSECQVDFCRPHRPGESVAATLLEEPMAAANVSASVDEKRPPSCQEDIALFGALLPHLQRGLRMHMHLSASQARGKALEAVLDGLASPMLLVSEDGTILFMNAAAERLVKASDGLALEGGLLRALLPDETKSLRRLVAGAAQACARQGRKWGGTVRISRSFGREPLEVLISALPARQDERIVSKPPVAVLFVTDRSRPALCEETVPIRVHGLTLMEAKVAVGVCNGLCGKEICRELDISYNTLKTHLKHIFAKTHTNDQRELARVLALGPRFSGAGEAGDPVSALGR